MPKGQGRKWTLKEKDYLRENVKGKSYKELAAMMTEEFDKPFTLDQIKGAINRYGFNTGRTGRFEKGHIPPNKSKKGQCAPGCEKGWFKKGHIPENHKPVGSERVDNKDGYRLVKVAEPNVWELKHRMLWEEANGSIPDGHVVTFLDGDKTNITLENLELISKAQNVRLNQNDLRQDDPELTKTGILIASVLTKAEERKRAK